MLHVIKSIARNDQTFVKNKTIMNETNISEPTLNKYFDILERFNLIESLPS
jgi:predicted AAA+ superfamily ATPase